MEHIWKLQEFCNSMAKLETDGYEYAYLKAIVLFSPGKRMFPSQLHLAFLDPERIPKRKPTKCFFIIVDCKYVTIGSGLYIVLSLWYMYCIESSRMVIEEQ